MSHCITVQHWIGANNLQDPLYHFTFWLLNSLMGWTYFLLAVLGDDRSWNFRCHMGPCVLVNFFVELSHTIPYAFSAQSIVNEHGHVTCEMWLCSRGGSVGIPRDHESLSWTKYNIIHVYNIVYGILEQTVITKYYVPDYVAQSARYSLFRIAQFRVYNSGIPTNTVFKIHYTL